MMGGFIKFCMLFFFGCYFIIQASHGQRKSFFRCNNNGKYIINSWVCDGDEDCPDEEDEVIGCNRNVCGETMFSCDNNSQCMNITVRCNTLKDCEDGSDELNCGDEINVKNCTTKDKFLCHDGLRCLDIEYTCDHSCHCFDCSDENENCFKEDFNLLRKCPNAYYITADGPQCLCNSSDDQSTTCRNIKSCDYCEQRCIKYKYRTQCSCFEGFQSTALPSGQRCKSKIWFENLVIYATDLEIKSLNVTSKNASTIQSEIHNCSALCVANNFVYYATPLPNNRGSIFKSSLTGGKSETIIETAWFENVVIYATALEIKSLNVTSKNASTVQSGIHNCSALSVSNNFVYYATLLPNNRGSISKSSLTGGKAETIIEIDFPVTSIAMDYVTNNTYFTSNGSISVCKNNGLICWELKCCGINYVNVAPKLGLMFYLQGNSLYAQDSALLMKSNMDGSNETILADDVYRRNISILVDEPEKKIYLLEMNDDATRVRMDRISLDGEIKSSISAMGVRSFGVNSGDMFYTVDEKNDIYHSEYFQNMGSFYDNSMFFRDESTSTTKFLYVYNRLLQNSSENPCSKSCSGLCLIKPSISPFSSLSYTCLCNNFTSTSGNRWCSNIPPPAAGHGFLIAIILAFVVFGVLCVTGYFIFLKRNWYQYCMTLRRSQKNKRDKRIVLNDLDER